MHPRTPAARVAALAIVALLITAARAQTWNDVLVATVPGSAGPVELRADIYAATAGAGPRPLLVWIHGGGWQAGSHNNVSSVALQLRARGISVAGITYRLSGAAIFPAQIHDCKGAIRFLRANAATFNIDPSRLAVWGSSAGGHLAALVTTSGGYPELEGDTGGNPAHSSRVLVGASYFGPTDLLNMQPDCGAQAIGCAFNHDEPISPESKLLGVTAPGEGLAWLRANAANPNPPFPEKIALATQANPLTFITSATPPLFISHGDQDRTVPIGQSLRLRDALAAAGVPHIYMAAVGAGHGPQGAIVDNAALDFISAHLLGCVAPVCRRGDTNCDGAVNFNDIDAFIAALIDRAGFALANPGCSALSADTSGDGFVSFDDITSFIECLIAGGCAA